MAIPSRPIRFPLPSATPPAVTRLAMNSLSHLRLATSYARFTTSSSSCCNRLSKVIVASAARVRVSSSTVSVLNDSWLASLSCPLPRKEEPDSDSGEVVVGSGSGSEWIIGVDPDVSGALALLRPDQSPCGFSAEVPFLFINQLRSPHLWILFNQSIPVSFCKYNSCSNKIHARWTTCYILFIL